MSGNPVAKSPGELIAEARRRRNLSLAELADRTRIPATMLAALEADEYHRLSGPLYARSFLRSCAKELGLVPEEVLDLYSRHVGEAPRPAGTPAPAPDPVRIRHVGLPWGRLVAAALGVVGVAALAFVLTRGGGEAPAPVTAADAGGGAVTSGGGWEQVAGEQEPAAPAASPVESGGSTPAGVPGLAFADGLTWPVVVRLRVPAAMTARARRDGQEEYEEVAWPGAAAAAVPAGGPEAGVAYGDGDGLVVYWGAVRTVSLVLGGGEGVELTVNGVARPLSLPTGGGEIVLDLGADLAPSLP